MKNATNTLRYKVTSRLKAFQTSQQYKWARKKVLTHYRKNPPTDPEIENAVVYLLHHRLSTFYGHFQEKYRYRDINVLHDSKNGLPYVLTGNKRLYFKRSHNKRTVQLLYNMLLIEQDWESPHCYTDESFYPRTGELLADVGCAEGYFSLLNVESQQRIFLFEQDNGWLEALEATFAPWREKVTIVPRFVGDSNSDHQISLDHFFEERGVRPHFCKIDVEGAEASVLKGMSRLINNHPLRIALCTYHHQDDFIQFTRFFNNLGFHQYPTPGVMVFLNDLNNFAPPFFRKCMIKATSHVE